MTRRHDLGLVPVHDADDELCVARVPVFATLPRASQFEVAAYAASRRLRAGDALYREGDAIAQLFVVHTGTAKLTHARADGERLIRTVGPGEVVGEHSFLTGARPDHTVTALADAQVCVFDHRDLGRIIAAHPRVAVEMLRAVSGRLQRAERRIAVLAGSDAATRLADYLLGSPFERDEGVAVVTLPLTKREIASYLGMTPESLSRALRRLERAGAIEVDGPRIRIVDAARLAGGAAD
ncbi:MAG: Crp/Fnr family transcriptional regulator [Microbacteriaceae bacterium]|nr:Crp/Fnr family transcriptional regulator [Microbacteriaceae bacterium]